MVRKLIFISAQVFIFVCIAPLLTGLITKIKNNLRMRKGQGVLQPYRNLRKLFCKEEVVSENASWVFKSAPFIMFASVTAASVLIPVFGRRGNINYIGDFFLIIFILAIGRFFMALAGMDTASSFGGMGSSREMFISSLVEPAACLAVFAISFNSGTTALVSIVNPGAMHISAILAVFVLFLAALAETSRLPVDNQETHLELTMIHEAMVLEYSGRSLALIEVSSYIKQMVWFSLLSCLIFTGSRFQCAGAAQALFYAGLFFAKVIGLAVIVSVIEVAIAKMRLFRVVDLFAFMFVVSALSMIAAILGI